MRLSAPSPSNAMCSSSQNVFFECASMNNEPNPPRVRSNRIVSSFGGAWPVSKPDSR
jgi:hypothetical protein